MTEIEIEKKKTIWPWILLGIILVAVALYFLFFKNKTDNTNVMTVDTTSVATEHRTNDTVAAYISFVEGDTGRMSLSHAYSSQALQKLVLAVRAKANDIGYDIKADLDKVNDLSDQITKNPLVTDHADKIKEAALIISTSLQNMQIAKYPSLNMQAEEVKSAASHINPDILTLDQKERVQSFFSKAATLLQEMN